MTRVVGALRAVLRLATDTVRSLFLHWGLALFSVLAAFIVWIVVEDVENPRAEGLVPLETAQPIPVVPLNVPDDGIVREQLTVRVRVDAREGDLPGLRANDFRATIDLKGVAPGELVNRSVRVESRRSGVRVISVQPASFDVVVARASTREVPVQVRLTGDLPSGYRLREGVEPVVEPAIVRLRGESELVASVDRVEISVSVSGARDETTVLEGELVPRSAGGNRVDVTSTPERGKVTLKIEQTLSQRTLTLLASTVGSPAPGYRVTNITIEPREATAAGPQSLMAFLQNLSVEKVDISGATSDRTQTRQIDRPPNITVDRQTVVVKVEIKPIECATGQPSGACGSVTLTVSPVFEEPPAGVTLESGSRYTVQVRVSGPLPQLNELRPADLRAVVSLRGAVPGVLTLPVTASFLSTAPTGLRLEPVDPVIVRLVPTTGSVP